MGRLLTPNMPSCYDLERIQPKAVCSHWILPATAKRRYYMKNIARLLCSWSLDAATKRNSLTSILSKAVLVAFGLLYLCSLPAFAAGDPNESNPPSLTNPPSPPPPTAPMPPSPAVPFDPGMHLTPEQGREYWDRYVTGDWCGLRTLLHNWGIDFNLDYFSEMAGEYSVEVRTISAVIRKGWVSHGLIRIRPFSDSTWTSKK